MADTRQIQKGKGLLATTAGTLGSYVYINTQSIRGSHTWEEDVVKDYGGFDTGWLAKNEYIEMTVSFRLTATSRALAAGAAVFLRPFAEVALSGFEVDWMNATGTGGYYTGSWFYSKGGSLDIANGSPGGMEITIRKYANPTQQAAALLNVAS